MCTVHLNLHYRIAKGTKTKKNFCFEGLGFHKITYQDFDKLTENNFLRCKN